MKELLFRMDSESEEEDMTYTPNEEMSSKFEVIPPIKTSEVTVKREKPQPLTLTADKFDILPPITSNMVPQVTSPLGMVPHAPLTLKLVPHPPSTPKLKKSRPRRSNRNLIGRNFTVLPQISHGTKMEAEKIERQDSDVEVYRSKGRINMYKKLPAIVQQQPNKFGIDNGQFKLRLVTNDRLIGKVLDLSGAQDGKEEVSDSTASGLTRDTIPQNLQEELLMFKEEIQRYVSPLSDSSVGSLEEIVISHEKYTYQEHETTRGTSIIDDIFRTQVYDGDEQTVFGKFAPAPPKISKQGKQDHWKMSLNESGYDSTFASFGTGESVKEAKEAKFIKSELVDVKVKVGNGGEHAVPGDSDGEKVKGGEALGLSGFSGSQSSINTLEP